jgi:hypothetical protein
MPIFLALTTTGGKELIRILPSQANLRAITIRMAQLLQAISHSQRSPLRKQKISPRKRPGLTHIKQHGNLVS